VPAARNLQLLMARSAPGKEEDARYVDVRFLRAFLQQLKREISRAMLLSLVKPFSRTVP